MGRRFWIAFGRSVLALGVASLPIATGCTATPVESADAGSGIVGCRSDPRVTLSQFPATFPSDDGTLHLTWTGTSPSVPLAGDNTWTLSIDAPADVSTITAKVYMPDHGHNASILPTFVPTGTGTWRADHMNFMMGGVWRITLTITRKGTASTDVVAFVCVDG